MSTALDLINDAFAKIGVYPPGTTLPGAAAQQGLNVLNDMLDSWSLESLMTYQILEQSGALVANKGSYTIGPGGDFNITRPIRINMGTGTAYILDSNNQRYPVDVVSRDQWNLIGNLTVQSNIPNTLFYDPQMPLGVINLYPQPNVPNTLYFDSYLQFTAFANLAATVTLPPGYKKALQDNLAVELYPYYPQAGQEVNLKMLIELAARSKANVKRVNTRIMKAVYDPELISRGQATYNIYRDTWGAR